MSLFVLAILALSLTLAHLKRVRPPSGRLRPSPLPYSCAPSLPTRALLARLHTPVCLCLARPVVVVPPTPPSRPGSDNATSVRSAVPIILLVLLVRTPRGVRSTLQRLRPHPTTTAVNACGSAPAAQCSCVIYEQLVIDRNSNRVPQCEVTPKLTPRPLADPAPHRSSPAMMANAVQRRGVGLPQGGS